MESTGRKKVEIKEGKRDWRQGVSNVKDQSPQPPPPFYQDTTTPPTAAVIYPILDSMKNHTHQIGIEEEHHKLHTSTG